MAKWGLLPPPPQRADSPDSRRQRNPNDLNPPSVNSARGFLSVGPIPLSSNGANGGISGYCDDGVAHVFVARAKSNRCFRCIFSWVYIHGGDPIALRQSGPSRSFGVRRGGLLMAPIDVSKCSSFSLLSIVFGAPNLLCGFLTGAFLNGVCDRF